MADVQAHIYRRVRSYTMTSPERVAALCQAIAYLEARHLPGAVLECGVWRGGSMMAAALALLHLRTHDRHLYLCDTFTGMPSPGAIDRDWRGRSALEQLSDEHVAARCSLDEVRRAMARTRYPAERTRFVAGRVEETLPREAPEQIALLRLDTDWHESTYHELEVLYPRLVAGGVLIIDDYGHWLGAQQAVDSYFAQHQHVDMHAIDYTGRLIIKPWCGT